MLNKNKARTFGHRKKLQHGFVCYDGVLSRGWKMNAKNAIKTELNSCKGLEFYGMCNNIAP